MIAKLKSLDGLTGECEIQWPAQITIQRFGYIQPKLSDIPLDISRPAAITRRYEMYDIFCSGLPETWIAYYREIFEK